MNDTVDPDSPIGREARDWALAVFGERLPPARAQALRAWLDADPRHARAYEDAEGLMTALADVPALARDPARAGPPRWLWAGGLAAAACLAIGVGVATRPATWEAGAAIRTVALRDGSVAVLAPRSRLREAGWWSGRRYALERGQALFDVRHAEGRRFEVAVGEARVTVLGTRFDVRKADDGVIEVAVQRGRVAVRRAAFETVLNRGQTVTLERASVRVGTLADPETVGAWKTGALGYAAAPLSEVVADINRFTGLRVAVDPAVAGIRVTASFRADQAGAFLDSLPALLPVALETRADGTRVIAPRARDAR